MKVISAVEFVVNIEFLEIIKLNQAEHGNLKRFRRANYSLALIFFRMLSLNFCNFEISIFYVLRKNKRYLICC